MDNAALIVFLVMFLLVFIIRMPVALGMLVCSVFYFMIKPGPAAQMHLPIVQMLSYIQNNFIIITAPLFIFMAHVMNSGKVTEELFKFAGAVVGKRKGGLGHVNVVASMIFSGMTGSAIADASGLGVMEIKAMKDNGYDGGFSCAVTAASATIGPVFPPSIPMVFYAMLSGASLGDLFLGGMAPGILLGAALMVYIAVIAGKKSLPESTRAAGETMLVITLRALPALMTVVVLLGAIYTGVVAPSEAGALAALYAMLISLFVYKTLGFKNFLKALTDTAVTTGNVILIVGTASIFSYIVSIEHIPEIIADFFLSFSNSKVMFLLTINLVLLALGMILDTSTIMLVFIPMVIPLIKLLNIDLVHFGVVIVVNMMIGLSTPPFGMLLFITSGISGTQLKDVIKAIMPMVGVMILVLFLITYIPQIVTFIPSVF